MLRSKTNTVPLVNIYVYDVFILDPRSTASATDGDSSYNMDKLYTQLALQTYINKNCNLYPINYAGMQFVLEWKIEKMTISKALRARMKL